MKKISLKIDKEIVKLEILTINEAKEAHRLTKDEAIAHHEWEKGKDLPVDDKYFIYTNDKHGIVFQKITEGFPSDKELEQIAINWINA